MVLQISQNLQENTWVGVLFKKIAGLTPLQLKTLAQLFSSEFWETFKNTFYIKYHWVAVSECLTEYFLKDLIKSCF